MAISSTTGAGAGQAYMMMGMSMLKGANSMQKELATQLLAALPEVQSPASAQPVSQSAAPQNDSSVGQNVDVYA